MPDRPSAGTPPLPAQERRQSRPFAADDGERKRSVLAFFALFVSRFKLHDIVSAGQHSQDFIDTRAEYIVLRLRFMTAFYVIAVPLWTPIDYLLLSPEHFTAMMLPKAALIGFLVPLGLYSLRRLSNAQVHALLTLNIVAAGLYYVSSMLILSQGATENYIAGYSLMPFMMVSMLGIFPLTLSWGVALIATIAAIYLGAVAAQGQLLTAATANMLWVLFVLAGIALWVQASQLLMLMRLYRESTQDPLTGMINRRVLMKRLAVEIEHVTQGGPSFCIQMFDLDRFKRINDNHGHMAGDKVLKSMADALQKGLRKQDIVARFGGEEFVAVLPDCKGEDAVAVAERIRQSCHESRVAAPNGESIQLSTSVGVTEYEPGEAIEVTLNRVDEALYKAKELGRNRVVHSQSV